MTRVRQGLEADTRSSIVMEQQVCFTPNSRHAATASTCRFRAYSETHAPQYVRGYSITSSALASNDDGTTRPRAFTVLRLMINSNLVGSTTGKSIGLTPAIMRPA
jgi:hypothetical protein